MKHTFFYRSHSSRKICTIKFFHAGPRTIAQLPAEPAFINKLSLFLLIFAEIYLAVPLKFPHRIRFKCDPRATNEILQTVVANNLSSKNALV